MTTAMEVDTPPKRLSTVKLARVAAALATFSDALAVIDGVPGRVDAAETLDEKREALTDGAVAFMSLKQGTRATFLGAEEVRKEVEAIKRSLDGQYRRLESLKYRAHRLAGEAAACAKAETPSLAEVARQGGPEITVESSAAEAQMSRLAVLDAEISERRRMRDLVEATKIEKRGVEAALEADRARLAKLPRLLSDLAAAAAPLEAELPTIHDLGSKKPHYLPRDLYAVWARLSACIKAEALGGTVTPGPGKVRLDMDGRAIVFSLASDRVAAAADDDLLVDLVEADRDRDGCYLWARDLALGDALTYDIVSRKPKSAAEIARRLAARVEHRRALDAQLSLLARRPPRYVVDDEFRRALGAPADALKAWTPLENFAPGPLAADPDIFGVAAFQASLQHNKQYLKATFTIPAAYPAQAPVVVIETTSFASPAALRDIQRELNGHYLDLVNLQRAANYLLAHQIAKLNQAFLALATQAGDASSSTPRTRRGRDRRRALLAAPELNHALVHRVM